MYWNGSTRLRTVTKPKMGIYVLEDRPFSYMLTFWDFQGLKGLEHFRQFRMVHCLYIYICFIIHAYMNACMHVWWMNVRVFVYTDVCIMYVLCMDTNGMMMGSTPVSCEPFFLWGSGEGACLGDAIPLSSGVRPPVAASLPSSLPLSWFHSFFFFLSLVLFSYFRRISVRCVPPFFGLVILPRWMGCLPASSSHRLMQQCSAPRGNTARTRVVRTAVPRSKHAFQALRAHKTKGGTNCFLENIRKKWGTGSATRA